MATRLYPLTVDPAKLEKLCRVPAGTAARHAALTAKWDAEKPAQYCGVYDAQRWDAFQADLAIAQYDNFLVFGWGRMNANKGVAGSTVDVAEVADLLVAQQVDGVDFNDCGGLAWS